MVECTTMVEGGSGVTVKEIVRTLAPWLHVVAQKKDTLIEHDSHGARVQDKRRRKQRICER